MLLFQSYAASDGGSHVANRVTSEKRDRGSTGSNYGLTTNTAGERTTKAATEQTIRPPMRVFLKKEALRISSHW